MHDTVNIPVITIDGPTGSGKGTMGRLLAKYLGWNFLDSGALYRALAYAVSQRQINLKDVNTIATIARQLNIEFIATEKDNSIKVLLDDNDISEAIRDEACGTIASKISAYPEVREALISCQRGFIKSPGLVADGRDMGTVIFPDALIKLYLDADISVRSQRRFDQLEKKGISASFSSVLSELVQRDERDKRRDVSPLRPAESAVIVDTTTMDVEKTLQKIEAIVDAKLK